MKNSLVALFALAMLAVTSPDSHAQASLVEPGHKLFKLVDSKAPLHPSQTLLDAVSNLNIESIAVDRATGNIYVQLTTGIFAASPTSIYEITPAGVVTVVNGNTGFGSSPMGDDMAFDPSTGLLVTMDLLGGRIATVDPISGAIGTYSPVCCWASISNFSMDFSRGVGGTDVPANRIVFCFFDGSQGNGIFSASFGGAGKTVHLLGSALPQPNFGNADLVIQPNGKWVHIGSANSVSNPISSVSPVPPHVVTPSNLHLSAMFLSVGLIPFSGARGTGCRTTGDLYVSYTGGPGGSAIFRVDASLKSFALIVRIGNGSVGSPNEGLQDLTTGPSTSGFGESLYFTIHDIVTTGEEVWELTLPECTVAGHPLSADDDGTTLLPLDLENP